MICRFCSIELSSEELVAIEDNVSTAPIAAGQRHFGVVESSKYILHLDSFNKNEMNNADPVLISSELGNIVKKNIFVTEDVRYNGRFHSRLLCTSQRVDCHHTSSVKK
ncbi:hypothetical protein TNCV_3857991 [Trichonephila clavipes]|nr:hypothetical protein TNCV_3857991 [Trichonephila clavipes]